MGIPTIPDFTGPLTPDAITVFLDNCSDAFDIQDQIHTLKLSEKSKVQLAGIHLKEPSASQWWNGNRSRLVSLATFALFADDFRKRFLHSNQQLDALRRLYAIRQGDRDYRAFVASLKLGRVVVNQAFTPAPAPAPAPPTPPTPPTPAPPAPSSVITDDQFNQLLVFSADPALIARVMTLKTDASIIVPGTKPEDLIAYMIKEWDALQAIRQAAGGAASGTGFGPADTYAGPPASSLVGPLGAQHMSSPFPLTDL